MILKLYDILYMGGTQTGLFIFFAMLDYRSFASKTGEFISLLETTYANSIRTRYCIPKGHLNSSLDFQT
jgi:hypothetical protein